MLPSLICGKPNENKGVCVTYKIHDRMALRYIVVLILKLRGFNGRWLKAISFYIGDIFVRGKLLSNFNFWNVGLFQMIAKEPV